MKSNSDFLLKTLEIFDRVYKSYTVPYLANVVLVVLHSYYSVLITTVHRLLAQVKERLYKKPFSCFLQQLFCCTFLYLMYLPWCTKYLFKQNNVKKLFLLMIKNVEQFFLFWFIFECNGQQYCIFESGIMLKYEKLKS